MRRGPYVGRGILGIIAIIALGVVLAESGANGDSTGAVEGARLKVTSVLGNNDQRYDARAFRGGEVAVVVGDVEVDLRESVMVGDEAVLEVDVLIGQITLRIPEGWTVVSDVDAALGVVDMRVAEPDLGPGAPRLILRGGVLIGGLTVRR